MASIKRTRRRFRLESLEARHLCAGLVTIYSEDFESSAGGFAIDNTGGTALGLWHYSVGRRADGLPNHSPNHNFYYGAFETSTGGGRFDVTPFDTQGEITSPTIQLPDCGPLQLSFNYLLDTRPEFDRDFASVSVLTSAGETLLLSRQAGTLPETNDAWRNISADLSPFFGQQIQLLFRFDTGPAPTVDPEGWYLDDLLITQEAPTARIGGIHFNDLNGNGVDDAEPRIAGVTVQLTGDVNADGTPDTLTTTTDAQGKYSFATDLRPGDYAVTFLPPSSYAGTPPTFTTTIVSMFACGETQIALPGKYLGSIHARKTHAGGGAAIAGLQFTLTGDRDGDGNQDSITQTTNVTGLLDFVNLFPGTYTLTELDSGSLAGPPVTRNITIQSGEQAVAVAGQAGTLGIGQFESAAQTALQLENLIQGSIHGYSFHDLNGNGADDSEPRLAGLTIKLTGDSNGDGTADMRTIVTDAQGRYDFLDLYPGQYTITEINPGTLIDPLPTSVITIGSGEEAVAAAGLSTRNGPLLPGQTESSPQVNLALGNRIFAGIHGIKVDSASGLPVSGVTLVLRGDRNGDGTQDEVEFVTTANGRYDFTSLFPGNYVITERAAATFASNPFSVPITVRSGEQAVSVAGQSLPLGFGQAELAANTTLRVANTFLGAIRGYKFNDVDGNGLDDNEPRLAGVTINLTVDTNGDGQSDVTRSTQTATDGRYEFLNVPVGTAIVTEIPPANTQPTTPTSVTVTITSGQFFVASSGGATPGIGQFEVVQSGLAFGNKVLTPTSPPADQTVQFISPLSLFREDGPFANPPESQKAISGFVWFDANANGKWNANEVGLDGVPVELRNSAGELIATEVTRSIDLNADGVIANDERGTYWFSRTIYNVPNGDYTVRVVLPAGQSPTLPAGSSDRSVKLTDAKPNVLGQAFKAQSPNFGLGTNFVASPPSGRGTVQGYLWNDINQDGVWDASERGSEGWSVFLDANGDGSFDPQTEVSVATGADGKYVFANISTGTYQVRVARDGLSDGTFDVQTFPAAVANTITLAAGQVVSGTNRSAVAGNFGRSFYSPLLRPADDIFGQFDLNHDNTISPAERDSNLRFDGLDFAAALQGWQTFTVQNQTSRELAVTQIDRSISTTAISVADEFVRVLREEADGTLSTPSFPMTVAAGQGTRFWVFYDPALRTADHQATEQFPEWFGNGRNTNAPHTFAADDHLEVKTQFTSDGSAGPNYRVNLVGGSTYDSDVFQDGVISNQDRLRISDQLLLTRAFVENQVVVQRVRIFGASLAGTFQLSYEGATTAPISLTATLAQIESALEALGTIDDVSVVQLGSANASELTWDVTFKNATHASVPVLSLNTSGVTGSLKFGEVTYAPFDPSSDINPRFQNGATETDPRRIGIGDLGTLNVEWNRARAPLLDLDSDNSSDAKGFNFASVDSGSGAFITDRDARFANNGVLQLGTVVVTLTNPLDGAAESFDTSALDSSLVVSQVFANGVVTLTLGPASVEELAQALTTIKYQNSAANRTAGERVIRIVATGGDQFLVKSIGSTATAFDQRTGNVAISRITVAPAQTAAADAFFRGF